MYFLRTGESRLPLGAVFVDEEEGRCLEMGDAGPPRDRPDIMLVRGCAMMRGSKRGGWWRARQAEDNEGC